MAGGGSPDLASERLAAIRTVQDLARVLRHLRRREARRRGGALLTYRELADRTGWSHGMIGAYFSGAGLPPTDRFDVLLRVLGAAPAEMGPLATVRDRVDELRRAAARAGEPTGAGGPPAAGAAAGTGTGPPGGASARAAVPAQLPPDVAAFTGRDHELALLDRLLPGAERREPPDGPAEPGGTALVIAALSGMAGVGKTALAVRWAHRVGDQFPDGQLYVDLRGYGPDQPVPAGDALAGFLRALGCTSQEIAPELEERAAQFRSALAGRRVLVILDNAATVDQVRPLLPGTGSSLVVVTSRNTLAALIARYGANRIDLDPLPPSDALTLLGRLVGAKAAADAEAALALTAQCSRLPLALRIVAELATTRADASLRGLVAELADEHRRLDLLDAGGDPRTAVRAVFSWSYQQLPAPAARLFRLLALRPGTDFDGYTAAALGGGTLSDTQDQLDVLTRAHLVQPVLAGRYGTHDLLRAYAAQLADELDGDADRAAARARMCAFYLATAAAAMDVLHPAEQHRRPRVPPATTPVPPFSDPAGAQAWLDAERGNLVASTLGGQPVPEHVGALAATLFRYFDSGGHYTDAVVVYQRALTAARQAGDRSGEARALCDLGVVYSRWVRLDDAVTHHRAALVIAEGLADPANEARALGNLAIVYSIQNRLEEAAEHHRRAHDVFRRLGDRAGQARALGNLGIINRRQGRPTEAVAYQRESLALFRELGERVGETEVRNALGESLHLAGEYTEARTEHTAALRLAVDIGNRHEQACAHRGLAAGYAASGEAELARRHWHQALEIYTELGLPEADEIRAHLADTADPVREEAGSA